MKKLPLVLSVLGALGLAAAWHDVLPGGWRLRQLAGRTDGERRYELHRARRLELFEREPVPAGAVVFLGSSTIERFPLESLFPGVPTLNRGIGDEPLADLDRRLDASVPADARAIVLYGGSVDFRRRPPGTVEPVATELLGLVARLRELRPAATLAVLGILPERGMSPAREAELRELNARLAAGLGELGASFVPTDLPALLAADRSLSEAFSSDRLHLNADGYEELSRALLAPSSPLRALLSPTPPR